MEDTYLNEPNTQDGCDKEITENSNPKEAVCLVVDTSNSIKDSIDEINNRIFTFFGELQSDTKMRKRVEICIVTFGDEVNCILNFDIVHKQTAPTLHAGGLAPMGSAVSLALDLLETRKQKYKTFGIDYYKPIMALITSGHSTDTIEAAFCKTHKHIDEEKVKVYTIGVGDNVDMTNLAKFSRRPPIMLNESISHILFSWLSGPDYDSPDYSGPRCCDIIEQELPCTDWKYVNPSGN